MKHTLTQVALLAAFACAGAAHAAETTNVPQRAGEASTMTGGAPNAKTTNSTTTSSAAMGAASGPKAAASGSGKGGASATTNVPDRAGQASTMTNGQPNKKTTN